jgi:hypothetical protein
MPLIQTFGGNSARGYGENASILFSYTQTGGTLTTSGIYNILTWNSSGNFTIKSGKKIFDILVVGAGGGGGYGAVSSTMTYAATAAGYQGGSGGGAGGIYPSFGQLLTPNSYNVTVGSGGVNGYNLGYPQYPQFIVSGTAGGSSSFGSITTQNGGQAGGNLGGNGGASGSGYTANIGAGLPSGGGGSVGNGYPTYGYTQSAGYVGGAGLFLSISGTNLLYAVGGNAPNSSYTKGTGHAPDGNVASPAPNTNLANGPANSAGVGDGGSGAWAQGSDTWSGGNPTVGSYAGSGYNGQVIIKWKR